MTQARTKRDIRARNLDTVLTAVSRDGLCTRNAIAEATGLHKSSVTSLVGELTQLGVLREYTPAHNGAAYWIKVSAKEDGSFTVTNARNGFSKTYAARK